MSFFVLLMIGFALMRLRGGRRRWRHMRYHGVFVPRMGGWYYRHGRAIAVQPEAPPPTAVPPRESRFELLKKRYVGGDLSDEQYERELDNLLSTPDGRRELN